MHIYINKKYANTINKVFNCNKIDKKCPKTLKILCKICDISLNIEYYSNISL